MIYTAKAMQRSIKFLVVVILIIIKAQYRPEMSAQVN